MDLNRTEITLEFKGFGNQTFKMMYLKAHGVTLGRTLTVTVEI